MSDTVGEFEDGKVIFSQKELEEIAELLESVSSQKGRKDYCCDYRDGKTHVVRASNSVSAMLKCMKHKPTKPVSVSKGNCENKPSNGGIGRDAGRHRDAN